MTRLYDVTHAFVAMVGTVRHGVWDWWRQLTPVKQALTVIVVIASAAAVGGYGTRGFVDERALFLRNAGRIDALETRVLLHVDSTTGGMQRLVATERGVDSLRYAFRDILLPRLERIECYLEALLQETPRAVAACGLRGGRR